METVESVGAVMKKNKPFRITEMFCFAVVGEDDDEGIPAVSLRGTYLPLVGADAARLESLIPAVQELQKQTKNKIRLYKFTNKEELDY